MARCGDSAYDTERELTEGELVYASEVGELAAVSADNWYLVEWDETTTLVTVSSPADDQALDPPTRSTAG